MTTKPLETEPYTLPQPRWLLKPPAPPSAVARLCSSLGIPPVLASILWSRGFHEDPKGLLSPPLALTPIPSLQEAAARLESALKGKKRILIHGDYDADGITGTAVLTLGLRALGGNVTPFLPNRLTDGYGISMARVPEHLERAELFLTVDCGISNIEEIAALTQKGVEVIVTDHHTPGQKLPDCLVVHPKMSGNLPGAPALTGSGVAYHLLWALHQRLGLEAPLEYSDIAAIGLIADVAPLLGENRALVKEGLKHLADSKWPGLRATISRSLAGKEPSSRDVAFVIAPRLNAAGRLGEAEAGLELLMTASERRARELAAYLDARNDDRRKIQDEMLKEALEQADPHAPALVLGKENWHPGVMGIVASKVLERFYKPVFIIAQGKGSVRSTPGISAVRALDRASAHLKRYGGHSQAAGFAIEDAQIPAFERAIHGFVLEHEAPQQVVEIDALLHPFDIGWELLEAANTLEPFGEGYPSPVFGLSDKLVSARAIGQEGKHLKLQLPSIKGVFWGQGGLARHFRQGTDVNLAVSLEPNEWNGQKSIEFKTSALRPHMPLICHCPEEDGNARIIRLAGAAPPKDLHVFGLAGEGTPWTTGDPTPESLLLLELPLAEDPLRACEPLQELVASSCRLHFSLSARALSAVEARLGDYPTLHQLRNAFVRLSQGRALAYHDVKAELCKKALVELELLDEHGRVMSRQKRDPYSAPTFLAGMMTRYRLTGLLNAYRYADDASFAATVLTLFESG